MEIYFPNLFLSESKRSTKKKLYVARKDEHLVKSEKYGEVQKHQAQDFAQTLTQHIDATEVIYQNLETLGYKAPKLVFVITHGLRSTSNIIVIM